jgi:hypothetical protein
MNTKRPFTVERGVEVYSADSRLIADCGDTDFTGEQQQAHAVLFAAAPDLYEALQRLVTVIGPTPIRSRESMLAYDAAVAAIAKVRGE